MIQLFVRASSLPAERLETDRAECCSALFLVTRALAAHVLTITLVLASGGAALAGQIEPRIEFPPERRPSLETSSWLSK
jgi:hypothetical protein